MGLPFSLDAGKGKCCMWLVNKVKISFEKVGFIASKWFNLNAPAPWCPFLGSTVGCPFLWEKCWMRKWPLTAGAPMPREEGKARFVRSASKEYVESSWVTTQGRGGENCLMTVSFLRYNGRYSGSPACPSLQGFRKLSHDGPIFCVTKGRL